MWVSECVCECVCVHVCACMQHTYVYVYTCKQHESKEHSLCFKDTYTSTCDLDLFSLSGLLD